MPNEMQMNPDYQLVMSFLQKIRPGDMDEESAQQLMIIGQRIQAGGVLSDQEREMFQSVVGATDRFPVEQMDTFPQGTNPDIMKQPAQGMGAMSDAEMKLAMNTAMPTNLTQKQMDQFMAQKNAAQQRMGAMQGMAPATPSPQMQKSYQVDDRMEQMTPMDMQEMIDAGIIVPKRPMTRPTAPMTSMRPQTRR